MGYAESHLIIHQTDLFSAEENSVQLCADETSEVRIVDSTPDTIIPDEFLHRSRSPTRTAYRADVSSFSCFIKDATCLRSENVFRKKVPVIKNATCLRSENVFRKKVSGTFLRKTFSDRKQVASLSP